jgi:hypothetical protein
LRACGEIQTASGQALDLLVERDDGSEIVLVANRQIRNDQRAEVRKIPGGGQDDFCLGWIAIDPHLEELVAELRVADFIAGHQLQNLAVFWRGRLGEIARVFVDELEARAKRIFGKPEENRV